MAKKAKKKKRVKKTKKPKKVSKRTKRPSVSTQKVQIQMQPVLVDNFVSLQKVMVNLANKFDNLNTQISKLLDLFEISAKSLAKKDFKITQEESNKEVLGKLGELSEQNKVIAKGLTMIHEAEAAPRETYTPQPMPPMPIPTLPPTPTAPPVLKKPETEEYKKSGSFKPLKTEKTSK